MIYISLGSNLGDRLGNLRRAVQILKQRVLPNLEESIVLETEAILPEGSPTEWNRPYLNMIVRAEAEFEPEVLLKILKDIEREIGRPENYQRYSPRLIDADILLMGDKIVQSSLLTLPRPELFQRNFLMHLLAMFDPQAVYQPQDNSDYAGKTFAEIAYGIDQLPVCFIRSFVLEPKLVGIVNVTPDSFSDGGLHFDGPQAIARALQLWNDGATIVELGAHSTRLNAPLISSEEEYRRLQPVLEGIAVEARQKNIQLGLDSFLPETISKVLANYPVTWINDQKGALDDKTLSTIAESGCKFVTMHSVTIPHYKDQLVSFNQHPFEALSVWAEKTLEKLNRYGFSEENIILDPGIGFGKSPYQNISLLREIHQLKQFPCQILVGHSRKSYMTTFSAHQAAERDVETLAGSMHLINAGVDYLRVHNVADHQRFFVAKKSID